MQPQGYADLHMHTTASDGKPTVTELLSFVAVRRPHLSVIAITDHDNLDASLWAYEQRDRYPFDIVPGLEVSSCAGHVLALWVTQMIPSGLDLTETVAAIHEAGGLAVLAHPFHVEIEVSRRNALRYWRNPTVLEESGIDAIEVYNAGVVTPGSNWTARQLLNRIDVARTGSSDAHTLGAIGSGVTRFPGSTAIDLRNALCQRLTKSEGNTWSISEYVGYLRHATQRKAMIYSVSTNSSNQASLPTGHQ